MRVRGVEEWHKICNLVGGGGRWICGAYRVVDIAAVSSFFAHLESGNGRSSFAGLVLITFPKFTATTHTHTHTNTHT